MPPWAQTNLARAPNKYLFGSLSNQCYSQNMKTVVITGASSGIGKVASRYFLDKGWKVIGLARRTELLEAQQKEWGEHFTPLACDLRNKESVFAACKDIKKQNSNLEGLVNNAGIFLPGTVEEDTDDTWVSHFEVNLLGPVRLTRSLWPLLKKSGQSSIVNISSTLGVRPIGGTGAYSALKAAMNNWTSTLALEGATFGIRANSVCPGIVDTPIHSFHNSTDPKEVERKEASQGIQPLGRVGQPGDISPVIYHLVSGESGWTTGAAIPVDGGMLLNS